MTEKIELVGTKPPKICTSYQKSEVWYSPEDKSWSWYGGSGINIKLTDKFSVDGYFAGKTTSSDTDGYLADIITNYNWGKCKTDLTDITFASQARFRYMNCGSENLQTRLTPLKLSLKNKSSFIPVDEFYTYPAYATMVNDLKSSDNRVKFGSLVGVSKNIDKNSSLYFEVQADTTDEKFHDSNWGFTFGYKHTF